MRHTYMSCCGRRHIDMEESGSVTVEAALALPLFIMVMAAFLFYFQLMNLSQGILQGLNNAGWQTAAIYNLENTIPGILSGGDEGDDSEVVQKIRDYAGDFLAAGVTSVYVRNSVLECVGEDVLDNSCIDGGSSGVLCYGYVSGDILKVGAVYTVRIPILPENIFSFRMTQQVTRRLWTGVSAQKKDSSSDEEEEEDVVYVTKYGTVYHIYKDCRSLKRSIKTCSFLTIGQKTNSSGHHYTACERCVRGSENAIVYVTDGGERYHNSQTCPSLLRYIEEKEAGSVGGKSLCSYCSKRQEEEDGDVQ